MEYSAIKELVFKGQESVDVPPCFTSMDGEIMEVTELSMVACFPVKSEYCNPAGSMQGGLLTAVFDNVFGPLSHIYFKTLTTTIYINTSYQRPVFPGDMLTVRAEIHNPGRNTAHMLGEARNRAGKLIASADTTYMILPPRK